LAAVPEHNSPLLWAKRVRDIHNAKSDVEINDVQERASDDFTAFGFRLLGLRSDQGNFLKSCSNDKKNGPLLGLRELFCLGKRPFKKKTSCVLKKSSALSKGILGPKNMTLRPENANFKRDNL